MFDVQRIKPRHCGLYPGRGKTTYFKGEPSQTLKLIVQELCESRGGRPGLSIVQELCESRGGRPGLSVLTSLLVSVDVKIY